MNPVLETVMLVVIAIIVLLVVVWVFGGFKTKKPDNQTELTTVPTETAKPVVHNYKVYRAPDLKDAVSGPRACTYIKTGHFFKSKTGDYYELLQSSSGAIFYITEYNTRRYLKDAEKLLPTYLEEDIL